MSKNELLDRLQHKKDHITSLLPVNVNYFSYSRQKKNDSIFFLQMASNKKVEKSTKEHVSNGSVKNKESSPQTIKDINVEIPKVDTPQHAQTIHCSSSMNNMMIKPEEIQTPTTHDNSITSDRSEATNTTSDDATTVISKTETNDEGSDDNHSQETCNIIARNIKSPIESSANRTTDSDSLEKQEVSLTEVYQIVDSIRQNTNLSHELSCVALRVVLSELETIFSTKILPFLDPIATHLSSSLEVPDRMIKHTHDAQRLKVIFSQLAECKNDSEQRTWMLYEDEEDITIFLKELIEILVILNLIC